MDSVFLPPERTTPRPSAWLALPPDFSSLWREPFPASQSPGWSYTTRPTIHFPSSIPTQNFSAHWGAQIPGATDEINSPAAIEWRHEIKVTAWLLFNSQCFAGAILAIRSVGIVVAMSVANPSAK